MKEFKGKVAVITGGASGVGKAIAHRLGREGVRLVIADIEQSALDAAVADLREQGIEAIGHVTDVSKLDSVEALADRSFSHYGAVHLLFNNAGVGPREAMTAWDTGINEWIWGYSVNVWGVIHGIKAFMPRLIAQNVEAHVVNTTSGNGGLYMMPQSSVYASTKAAVSAITETVCFQLQAMGSPVKISALFPGPHIVRTGIYNSQRVRPADLPPEESAFDPGIHTAEDLQRIMEGFGKKIEITSPEEVADQVFEDLQADRYWMLRQTERSVKALRERTESIIALRNPTPPDVL